MDAISYVLSRGCILQNKLIIMMLFSMWLIFLKLCSFCLCRKWDLEQTSKPNTPPFANWIKGVIHEKELDLSNLNDLDAMLLCNKPSQVAL
jgi:hypothetical protein